MPQSAEIYLALGNICLKMNDYNEAIKYYKSVLQYDKADRGDKYLKALE